MKDLTPVLAVLVALLLPAPAQAAAGPSLAVTAGAGEHPINADIYGMNYADAALAKELALPVNRWGGNTTDTYNWRLGSYNTGNDYFFENLADCWTDARKLCDNGRGPNTPAYPAFIDGNRATGTKTLLTLPLLGRVAKNAKVDHPFTCGFPASAGPSAGHDPYDTNCGNGVRANGQTLASDPDRDSVPSTAADNGAWVADLIGRYGTAAGGGVQYYELGNEPGLWSDTHRDMHPSPQTYDELWQKSRDTAILVKQEDPSAKVLGFSEWGWPNYFCSASDNPDNGCDSLSPDRRNHGGVPEVDWFLQQARAYEQANGTRLLDYVDVHYYRQGGTTPDVTRSLWDPAYTDPSYINDTIRLIPRMHEWVDGDYPGTKLALSEYNLSVPNDPVLNAIIQADTLGIFAREGLDLATRFAVGDDGPKIADAFRMFRDYDGMGARFGDTWLRSTSVDQGSLAVYAARRGADGTTTVLVVNKTSSPLTSSLALGGVDPASSAGVWQYAGDGIARLADLDLSATGFSATYPARSLTMIAIPPAGGSPPPGTPGPVPGPGAGNGGGAAALTARALLAATHLSTKVRAGSKGAVTLGYATCPPVCGTLKLTTTLGKGSVKVSRAKRTPLVLRLSRAALRKLVRARRITLTVKVTLGKVTAKRTVTVLAPKRTARRKG